MSHVVAETTAEGEGFNFNQWLINNDFLKLKDIFIKHGATTATTLQISSPEIQRLMADPDFLSQPQMVPKVVMAIHQLAVVERIVTVVLSEKEQEAMDRIKREREAANQMEEEVTRLKSEYPKSQERFRNMKNKQIATVTAQINEAFDALYAALSGRKEELLGQLNQIETIREDDENYDDDLSFCIDDINDLKAFLNQKEKEYNDLLSVEKDNAKRENKIFQIRYDVDIEVLTIQKDVGESIKSVREQTRKNNETGMKMNFVMRDGTYDHILAEVAGLGEIIVDSEIENAFGVNVPLFVPSFLSFPEEAVDSPNDEIHDSTDDTEQDQRLLQEESDGNQEVKEMIYDGIFETMPPQKQRYMGRQTQLTTSLVYESDMQKSEEEPQVIDTANRINVHLTDEKRVENEQLRSLHNIHNELDSEYDRPFTHFVDSIDGEDADNDAESDISFTTNPFALNPFSKLRTSGAVKREDIFKPLNAQIATEVHPINEEIEFEHGPVRAWKYDTEQNKWRRRGKGKVGVYWNQRAQLGLLRFTDEKHNRIRLLQWINGDGSCEWGWTTAPDSNNGDTKLNKEELEWSGADYTMNVQGPMTGKWKLNFMENEEAASHFISVFNELLDEAKVIHEMDSDNGHNDGHDDDGNVMTFGVNDNIQDPPGIAA